MMMLFAFEREREREILCIFDVLLLWDRIDRDALSANNKSNMVREERRGEESVYIYV